METSLLIPVTNTVPEVRGRDVLNHEILKMSERLSIKEIHAIDLKKFIINVL